MPENGSVVVLSGVDGKGGGCVGFTARVSGNDFDFATVNVATLGDVEMPHAVVNQLVFASLFKTNQKTTLHHLLPRKSYACNINVPFDNYFSHFNIGFPIRKIMPPPFRLSRLLCLS